MGVYTVNQPPEVKCKFKITSFVNKSAQSFGNVLSLRFCLHPKGKLKNNTEEISTK